MHTEFLLHETVFLNRSVYEEAERHYSLKNAALSATCSAKESVSGAACQAKSDMSMMKVSDLVNRLAIMELENKALKTQLASLGERLALVESGSGHGAVASTSSAAAAPKKAEKKTDDDFDLFDDDEEEDSEEKKRITEERLSAYNAKKTVKPGVIAKSSVLFDVKPWDDETDMKELEKAVRTIVMDGLIWGTSKLVPVAYNIKKMQIQCVIEDDKVSTEALEEQICAFEDWVQSVDIAAFNKI